MAELAARAGYDALQVLRGREATRQAVDDALARAAQTLTGGDTLLVSFSGHGSLEDDWSGDEGYGWDEAWCLHDGIVLDDKLAGFWRLFEPGVRIVVVAESCYSGGSARSEDSDGATPGKSRKRRRAARSAGSTGGKPGPAPGTRPETNTDWKASCISGPPLDTHGIQASVLLLAASTEDQTACDGVYTEKLMEVWDNGAFQGSYCQLHECVRNRVMCVSRQEPQILMLGAPDAAFPLETAFHRDPSRLRRSRTRR